MRRTFSALLAGLLFGAGLAISQMTNPLKVLGFLDVTGKWDASLILVLSGAVMITFICFKLVLLRGKPVFDIQFHLPKLTAIDRPLIIGAMLFGLGWGIAGYCPGPGLASLTTLLPEGLVFVATMLAGMLLQRLFNAPPFKHRL